MVAETFSQQVLTARLTYITPVYYGLAPLNLSAGRRNTLWQSVLKERRAMGLCLECGKERHMRAQCPEKTASYSKRRQLIVTQAEIIIVEELEEEKPAET